MNEIYGGYTNRGLLAGSVGVVPKSAVTNQFLTAISESGAITSAQPEMSNVSDYLVGTWTPSDQSGAGIALTVMYARYVKIGKLITCFFHVTYPATVDMRAVSISLPFVSDAAASSSVFGGKLFTASSATPQMAATNAGVASMRLLNGSYAGQLNANMSELSVRGQIQYFIA